MILITGAAGFVGSYLLALCAQRAEAQVVGVGRGPAVEIPGMTQYERLDLLDADAVRELVARVAPTRVFHLAANASVPESWRMPATVIDNNVRSTLNLLEALRQEAPEARVLLVGSAEEYGPPQYLPVDESHPLSPRNPYATSKAMVEQLAEFYVEMHGMSVVRTRAFNHVGPGQSDDFVVSAFARQIAEAEAAQPDGGTFVISTGNLEVRRDFSDVRDVVRAYWLALEAGDSAVYNVCSGRPTLVSDILTGLVAHSPLEVERQIDPSRLRDNEVMEIRGSHERLTEVTGWRPEIDLSETLRDTLDWWRERVAAGVAR